MKGIFISYRRADSAPYAGRICDHLRRTFPSLSVFMDVEAINPGSDFIHAMDANLADSAVVLAVIGPQWESIRASTGQLESANDYVMRELATALQGQKVVIPLLVGGAKMPSTAALPPALHELSRRNALEISDSRFAEDADRLCKAISGALDLRDDQQSRQRVEYGRFFSDAELTRAHTTFRRLVWISFALVILYTALSQFAMGVTRVNSSSESIPTLNCDDPSLTTADERAACVAMNATMQRGASFMETLDRVVLPFFLLFFAVLLLLVHLKVLRGKRWARIAFAVVGGAVALSVFDVLFSNPLRGALYVAQVVLHAAMLIAYAWAIRMMFTEPVRRWFARA